MRKIISVTAFVLLSACQANTNNVLPVTVMDVPASDAADSLDFSNLPDGFPVIAEMKLSSTPSRCGLSKLNRFAQASQNSSDRYVFTYQGEDGGVPIYQVGINGVVRSFKQSEAADMHSKKVRYFKTVDAPEVEIQIVLEPDGSSQKSTLARVKAWDNGLALMCAYNRIEVTGDCDL